MKISYEIKIISYHIRYFIWLFDNNQNSKKYQNWKKELNNYKNNNFLNSNIIELSDISKRDNIKIENPIFNNILLKLK